MQHDEMKLDNETTPSVDGQDLGSFVEYLAEDHPFVVSENLEEVEQAIQKHLRHRERDTFGIALLIARIENDKLFTVIPGCDSPEEYFLLAQERLCMPRQTVSHYRKIAQGFSRHKMHLATYSIDPREVVTKLAYLNLACTNHPDEEPVIFEHLKSDSARDFRKFADTAGPNKEKSEPTKAPSTRKKVEQIDASELDPRQAAIAGVLSRRNIPKIVAVTNDRDEAWLREQLHQYRSKVYADLIANLDKGLSGREPLNVRDNARIFAIEEGIRRAMRQADVSEGAVAVAIYRIGFERVLINQWGALGFASARAFCETRLQILEQYDWYRRIGKSIFNHSAQLMEAGFGLQGNLYKLYYLEDALKQVDDDGGDTSVYQALSSMSFREFKRYARGEAQAPKTVSFSRALVERAFGQMAKVRSIIDTGRIPVILELIESYEVPMVDYRVAELNNKIDSKVTVEKTEGKEVA